MLEEGATSAGQRRTLQIKRKKKRNPHKDGSVSTISAAEKKAAPVLSVQAGHHHSCTMYRAPRHLRGAFDAALPTVSRAQLFINPFFALSPGPAVLLCSVMSSCLVKDMRDAEDHSDLELRVCVCFESE